MTEPSQSGGLDKSQAALLKQQFLNRRRRSIKWSMLISIIGFFAIFISLFYAVHRWQERMKEREAARPHHIRFDIKPDAPVAPDQPTAPADAGESAAPSAAKPATEAAKPSASAAPVAPAQPATQP